MSIDAPAAGMVVCGPAGIGKSAILTAAMPGFSAFIGRTKVEQFPVGSPLEPFGKPCDRMPSSSPPDRPARSRHRCAPGPSQRSGSSVPPRRSPPQPRRSRPEHDRDRAAAARTSALPLTLPQHVILYDHQAADIAVLDAQRLEDPLRGVPLLRWTTLTPPRLSGAPGQRGKP